MSTITVRSTAAALLAVLVGAGMTGTTSASAASCVWSGAISGNWSVPLNWSCLGGPALGDSLEFPDGATTFAMNQDIANLSIDSLTFSGIAGGYSLTGTGNLTITGAAAITSKVKNPGTNTLALTNPIEFFAATAVIDTTAGAHGLLNLDGPIHLNDSVLNFVWDSPQSVRDPEIQLTAKQIARNAEIRGNISSLLRKGTAAGGSPMQ